MRLWQWYRRTDPQWVGTFWVAWAVGVAWLALHIGGYP